MVAFAGGVLVGSVAALLFAPKRGDEMRRDIKERIDEAKAHIKKEMACCKPSEKVVEENLSVSFEE